MVDEIICKRWVVPGMRLPALRVSGLSPGAGRSPVMTGMAQGKSNAMAGVEIKQIKGILSVQVYGIK